MARGLLVFVSHKSLGCLFSLLGCGPFLFVFSARVQKPFALSAKTPALPPRQTSDATPVSFSPHKIFFLVCSSARSSFPSSCSSWVLPFLFFSLLPHFFARTRFVLFSQKTKTSAQFCKSRIPRSKNSNSKFEDRFFRKMKKFQKEVRLKIKIEKSSTGSAKNSDTFIKNNVAQIARSMLKVLHAVDSNCRKKMCQNIEKWLYVVFNIERAA